VGWWRLLAAKELARVRATAARAIAGERLQRGDHRIEPGEHSSLQPAERRQPEAHQRPLQRPDIAMPQGPVVRQVEGADREGPPRDQRPPPGEAHSTLGSDGDPQRAHRGEQLLGRC
jgi:hypothetical protein